MQLLDFDGRPCSLPKLILQTIAGVAGLIVGVYSLMLILLML